MPRAGKVKKRTSIPDPIYQSYLVAHLINHLMISGKKSIAQKQVYQALEFLVKEKEKENLKALDILSTALENIKPAMEVRSRRIGGAAYQVPAPVRTERRESLALRWLINAARSRSNKEYHHFWQKLAAEILDAYNNTGAAIKKKQDVHKMADANKAFAHFRW
ncbi:MAG: 30S ribosomal protein S7 [Candidatus Shapirobacteria bacterium]|nr:30S ribosomal protein S7 [Candidatus Shapirobacteria bacterium]